ncbi:hypothetical protein ACIHCV_03785 [Streptomyces sp. NPDC051956]|uniref:hypothetical protein n=1 Tax=Streptomyces sp. NPDC051956 TaxID=3365677 RepID=UPI0037CF5705
MSGCGLATGFGSSVQPQQGSGRGQFDGALVRTALALGQSAVQLVGPLRLGEGILVAGLAVEAAGQAEPQDQGRPVEFAMNGQRLAGERLSLLVAPLRVEGEYQSVAGGRRQEWHFRSGTAARGLGDGRTLCFALGVLTKRGQLLGAV